MPSSSQHTATGSLVMLFKMKAKKMRLVFIFSVICSGSAAEEDFNAAKAATPPNERPVPVWSTEPSSIEKLSLSDRSFIVEALGQDLKDLKTRVDSQLIEESLKKVLSWLSFSKVVNGWDFFIKQAHKGVPKAQEIIKIAAQAVGEASSGKAHSPEVKFNIALLFLKGIHVKQNIELYMKWLKEAAEGKSLAALYLLAEEYTSGKWIEKNEGQAIELLKEASRLGLAEASYELGRRHLLGEFGENSDPKKAVSYMQKAASENLAEASYELGKRHLLGEFGENSDPKKAVFYLQKAASEDLAKAQIMFANLLASGFPYDYKNEDHKKFTEEFLSESNRELLIIQWYRRAAEQGSGEAQITLGLWLFDGHPDLDLPENEEEGLKFLTKAAQQSENMAIKIKALSRAAFIYQYGTRMIDSDFDLAAKFYKELDRYPDEVRKYLDKEDLEKLEWKKYLPGLRRQRDISRAFSTLDRKLNEVKDFCRWFFTND